MLKYDMNINGKFKVNTMIEGQSIEEKLRKVMLANEPIDDTSPLIYTEMKEGVLPQYDIRTDRFDIALDAMDKVNASLIAKSNSQPGIVEDNPNKEFTPVTD